MANQTNQSGGVSGSGLQESQSGGGSGEFGGNREQQQGGQRMGGAPDEADLDSAGGSSGTGGYGSAQNQENHQGQQGQASYGNSGEAAQSRGERFDEMQGGGRAADSVSAEEDAGEQQQSQAGDLFLEDRQAGPDSGRTDAQEEDETY
ncbi:MAG TPA: hypothetical protein VF582_03510 [Allosphingosinicella sp.]|jgi:hypothetical protein